MFQSSYARIGVVAVLLLSMTACSNLDDTQQKMLSGGAAGAVIGTVGVAITGGCIPCGTAIGGAVGAGTGYVLDKLQNNSKSDSSSNAPAPSAYNSSNSSSYNYKPPANNYNGNDNGAYPTN